jgi:hypothetical protein
MTKYLDKTFSVAVGSDDYRANWDAVFGQDETKGPKQPLVGDLIEVKRATIWRKERVTESSRLNEGGHFYAGSNTEDAPLLVSDCGVTWRWAE